MQDTEIAHWLQISDNLAPVWDFGKAEHIPVSKLLHAYRTTRTESCLWLQSEDLYGRHPWTDHGRLAYIELRPAISRDWTGRAASILAECQSAYKWTPRPSDSTISMTSARVQERLKIGPSTELSCGIIRSQFTQPSTAWSCHRWQTDMKTFSVTNDWNHLYAKP